MPAPLITLTTDFGLGSPYVAAMKGAILSVNAEVQLLDLSHSLPPQDLRACSWFLRSTVPFFPPETLHVIVVDPGVGSERALLYVETGGQRLLVPDNGCWTEFASLSKEKPRVIALRERRYWHSNVSSTFHGRDILAPVAGHLSLGLRPETLGPAVTSWVEFTLPLPRITGSEMEGEILFIDDFGNLITNLPGDEYLARAEKLHHVELAGKPLKVRPVRTYAEATQGELVLLVSSGGTVELAEAGGHAARRLGAAAGDEVRLSFDG